MEARFVNNGILKSFGSIYECVKCLFGIQSQYNLYSYISIFNRVDNISIEDIYKQKDKIVRSWGQRITLHIYTMEDVLLIPNIFGNRTNWITKYFNEMQIDIDKSLGEIESLRDKYELIDRDIIEKKISDTHCHNMMQWGGIVALASLRGYIYEVINEKEEKKYKFLNKIKRIDDNRDVINYLIKRYIEAYGPASIDDFVHWSGLGKNLIRESFMEIGSLYDKITYDKIDYYGKTECDCNTDKLIMIGKFDPLLLSYKNKDIIINKTFQKYVWRSAGHVDGIILKYMEFIGTWKVQRFKNNITFRIYLAHIIDYNVKDEIEINVKKYARSLNYDNVKLEYHQLI